jgi:uncharacterized protein YbjQ (UPF0145 family)
MDMTVYSTCLNLWSGLGFSITEYTAITKGEDIRGVTVVSEMLKAIDTFVLG